MGASQWPRSLWFTVEGLGVWGLRLTEVRPSGFWRQPVQSNTGKKQGLETAHLAAGLAVVPTDEE